MSCHINSGSEFGYYEKGADDEQAQARAASAEQAAADMIHETAERSADYAEYMMGHRQLEGVWLTRFGGPEDLGLSGNVTPFTGRAIYGKLEDPATGNRLGRKIPEFRPYAERLAENLAAEPFATPARVREIEMETKPDGAQVARKFFDIEFDLDKDLSLLHAAFLAAGDEASAQAIWDAHHHAQDKAIQWWIDNHGESRQGAQGCERVRAERPIISRWDHRSSRCGDVQIHSHNLIANRIKTAAGKWLAPNMSPWYKTERQMGAWHERWVREELAETLGLEYEPTENGHGWRVKGITQELIDLNSSRRRAMEPVVAARVAEFVEANGRQPTKREMFWFSRSAALKTRPPKPHEKTYAEYIADIDQNIEAATGQHLAGIVGLISRHQPGKAVPHGVYDRSEILKMAVARAQATKPTFGRQDLCQTISEVLPINLGRLSVAELDSYINSLVDEAVGSERVKTLHKPEAVEAPGSLRLPNGQSVYERPLKERYTTHAQLSDERGVDEFARRTDGPRLGRNHGRALVDATTLYDDQGAVVFEALTRGQRVMFIEALAGSGKSYTVGQLSDLWQKAFGRRATGTSKAANATEVLADSGVKRAFKFDTIKTAHEALEADEMSPKVREVMLKRYAMKPGELLIVDEASMFADDEIVWLLKFADENEISVAFVGDRGQLGTIGPQVMLDIIAKATPPLVLDTARRQDAEWERRASEGLHAREPAAIAQYGAHGRLYSGTREEMMGAVVDRTVADIISGRDAVAMTPTIELSAEVSSHIRLKLIELHQIDTADEIALRDGTFCSTGDIVNPRHTTKQIEGAQLGVGANNRDPWKILGPAVDGLVPVRLQKSGEEINVPANYFAEHVVLGYATTAHAKQGRTADRSYGLGANGMDFNSVYVQLTRGSELNMLFMPVEHVDGVAHETCEQVLVRLAERDDRELSATEAEAYELELPTQMGTLGPIYENEMVKQTTVAHEAILRRVMDTEDFARLQTEDIGAIFRLTHALEREGHDIESVITENVTRRELTTADEISKVLHSRITRSVGPVAPGDVVQRRYLDAVPAGDTPELRHLRAVAEQLDRRRDALGERQVQEPEQWAIKHLGRVPDDPIERLAWTEKAGQVAAYRERYDVTDQQRPIGDAPGRNAAEQRAGWEQCFVALGRPAQGEDVARLSDGELLLAIDQYKRREAWMPPAVDKHLETTSRAANEYATRAVLDRAEGRTEDAERGERMAALMAERVAKYEVVHEARRLAEEHTADERHRAETAALEYKARHDEPAVDEPVTQQHDEREEYRSFTMDDALDRARQVTAEIEAERAYQAEQRGREAEHHEREQEAHEQGY